MNISTCIVTVILMIAYAVFGVWQIVHFRKRSGGIIGICAIMAGSIGVYLISPIVAAVLIWLFKAVCVIAVIALILFIFG